ncbi:sensor histidine kinase [Burkholderia lata]|uniref:histidine kinase n=1 Tax=Burkholderia lata (strain ATCC 17760 / DSM 23089 / LMG 22485 / NCIMB 9086 / R18194 / 383) TaxID=482957 RepID=A0A6P2WAV4_BURL3|nr:ATP-binding protein [Burkholderia lata]VWC98735.1 Sensor protein baeS [Burkholderia lata]
MSALAIGAVVAVAIGMLVYFNIEDARAFRRLSPEMQHELEILRAHPHRDQARLWQLYRSAFDIDRLLPTLDSPDWLALAMLITMTVPFIVVIGLWLSRPLSRQFTLVARAAHSVSAGNFSARVPLVRAAPDEASELATDFNAMTERLQQYERELRESSAMMAHEFRTPLNAAMGHVQGMLDDVFPRNDEQLERVYRQLEQINRLAGDLHLASLARAGHLVLKRDDFSLGELIDEQLQWAAPMLRQAGIAVSHPVGIAVGLHADRDRIGQVLSILIDNVLRYAADGKTLEIDVRYVPTGISIIVSDRGPGVAHEHLARMQDRFWRAERSRARHSGGSGLGLAIAAAICRNHGGNLKCSNRENGGMSMTVCLPHRAAD